MNWEHPRSSPLMKEDANISFSLFTDGRPEDEEEKPPNSKNQSATPVDVVWYEDGLLYRDQITETTAPRAKDMKIWWLLDDNAL